MKKIKELWHRLFLEERSSISLSMFRIAAALTTGFHVLPTLCHLGDNYFSTAYKALNTSFFPIPFLEWVQKSPDGLVVVFVWIFCISWFFFLIGLRSQISCIIMVLSCYYFYALNAFHVGTLSWDILLVTLFLMCITPYHGDYFSLDSLRKGDEKAYARKRPYFLQRLLQLQIAFTYFYTALYKVTAQGNWLRDNPIHYIMNYPAAGTAKYFILRDYLANQPELCYIIGISIFITEFLMLFLLFWPKTRLSAIYLGFVFQTLLLLTLDVPAIFFFLFPPQLLLFIHPQDIEIWIEQKRSFNRSAKQALLIYDGHCKFCINSVRKLKVMDLFETLKPVDFQVIKDIKLLHPELTSELTMSQLYLIETDGQLYGGYHVMRRICWTMPMLYPFIPIIYFPGMGIMGPIIYKFIAKNRYLLHGHPTCQNNACFKKSN